MGIRITTDEKGLMIWRDDKGQYPNYSYSISRKNDEGNYENAYRQVRFKKGVDLPNKTLVQIKDAFESFNVGKDGKKYPYLMITDFSVMGDSSPVDIPDTNEEVIPFK